MGRGARLFGLPLAPAAGLVAAVALSSCADAPVEEPPVDLRLDFLSPGPAAPLPYLGPLMPHPPAAVIVQWNPDVYQRTDIDSIAQQQCIIFEGYAQFEGPVSTVGHLLSQRFTCVARRAPFARPR